MPQENINTSPLPDGTAEVKPQEPVTVYATDKLAGIHPAGEEMTVHRALAAKMIASGKVTKDKPKAPKAAAASDDKDKK